MKKLKFENKQGWHKRAFYCSRKRAFVDSIGSKSSAIDIGWLYVFFWDNKLQEEFSE